MGYDFNPTQSILSENTNTSVLSMTLKSDSTRGPCGSKTSPVWSSVTAKFFCSLLQHTELPAKPWHWKLVLWHKSRLYWSKLNLIPKLMPVIYVCVEDCKSKPQSGWSDLFERIFGSYWVSGCGGWVTWATGGHFQADCCRRPALPAQWTFWGLPVTCNDKVTGKLLWL